MLARDGNGHDPRASGPFILRPEPKVAPPLERSESRRAECLSELLLLPNAQRGFVEADVSSALPLDDGQERSEEHTSELQSRLHLVCRLLLEKKKNITN